MIMFARWFARLACVSLLGMSAACDKSPATQFLVVVQVSDEQLAAELSQIRAKVYAVGETDPDAPVEDIPFEVGGNGSAGAQQFPFSFAIVQGRESRLRLVVEGYSVAGRSPVIEHKVTASFQPEQARIIHVVLTRGCYDRPCASLDETCDTARLAPGTDAECVAVEEAVLLPASPGNELDDAGTGSSVDPIGAVTPGADAGADACAPDLCFEPPSCGTDGCVEHAHCELSAAGAASCVCDLGYLERSGSCAAPDGCIARNGGCDPLAECESSAMGDVRCTCKSGYAGDGRSCSPVDPCADNRGGCDLYASCTMTGPGTRACTCDAGYVGDGLSCRPSDLCLVANGGCDTHATCASTGPGTRSCTCMQGYTGDGAQCIGINACAVDNGGCATHATCSSAGPGTRTCLCMPGYRGDGTSCAPIDACASNNGGCDSLAQCVSTGPGTNSCSCRSGYAGDGRSCSPVNLCETSNGGCNASLPCAYTGPGTRACLSVVELATGDAHNCALMSDGTARCWGLNQVYQLGATDGELHSARPLTVGASTGSVLRGATHIYAGAFYSCALASNGTPLCWGGSAEGVLGPGQNTDTLTPVALQTAPASTMSPGHETNCVVSTQGQVWCWGANRYGQLGDGTTTSRVAPVSPLASGIRRVKTAEYNTCAVANDGTLYCWGSNFWGQIGDGTTVDRLSPVRVLAAVSDVAVGYDHTCALLTSGAVQCWGQNHVGQLGDGSTVNTASPVPIITAGAISVCASAYDYAPPHSCAVVNDGRVLCWGSNEHGQLGDGTTTDRLAPVVAVRSGALSVTCGTRHTCALMQDGTVSCWGTARSGASPGLTSPSTVAFTQ
jgi:alpha-tubulin suppressor-like RCC1 family protein